MAKVREEEAEEVQVANDVFWLEVAMNDLLVGQISQCSKHTVDDIDIKKGINLSITSSELLISRVKHALLQALERENSALEILTEPIV